MKKILLVDDDPDIRKTVKTVLEKYGYRVTTAANADDCLEKLKAEQPDLVLLDIMMPGTLVKDAMPKIKAPKIAFFTVVGTTEAGEQGLTKGKNVVDYIQKPSDINELVKRVKKILGE